MYDTTNLINRGQKLLGMEYYLAEKGYLTSGFYIWVKSLDRYKDSTEAFYKDLDKQKTYGELSEFLGNIANEYFNIKNCNNKVIEVDKE